VNYKSAHTLWLNSRDNVVVALRALSTGEVVPIETGTIQVVDPIPFGHKMAIQPIPVGASAIKYGEEIGEAKENITPGQHVHVHNLRDITSEVSERERKRLGL
jgi:hypothetical protein